MNGLPKAYPSSMNDVPIGAAMQFGGAAVPAPYSKKWLLCNGSAISRAVYAKLFAVIGTAFGVGDGSTTFNLPAAAGKCPIGADGTHARGASGGNVNHTHAISVPVSGTLSNIGNIPNTGSYYAATIIGTAAGTSNNNSAEGPWIGFNFIIKFSN